MYIVTGKTGSPHVTGADDAAFNSAVFGPDMYVIGEAPLEVVQVDTGRFQLSACEILIQGIHARVEGTEVLQIGPGGQGEQRIDSIVAEYVFQSGTGLESVTEKIVQGTPSASTPVAPELIVTDQKKQMELARIMITGNTVQEIRIMAKAIGNVEDLADDVRELQESTATDSGWKYMEYLNGASAYGSTVVKYRKIGKSVHMTGRFAITGVKTGEDVNVFALPAGFRPTQAIYNMQACTGRYFARMHFNTNGSCYLDYVIDPKTGEYVTGDIGWVACECCFFVA